MNHTIFFYNNKQQISPLELDKTGPNEGRDEEREHKSRDGSVCPHGSPPDFGQQGLCKTIHVKLIIGI